AAACEAAIISDDWPGLNTILTPGREILVAHTSADVVACLDASESRRHAVAMAGRARILAAHTSDRRAAELESCLAGLAGHRRRCSAEVIENVGLTAPLNSDS